MSILIRLLIGFVVLIFSCNQPVIDTNINTNTRTIKIPSFIKNKEILEKLKNTPIEVKKSFVPVPINNKMSENEKNATRITNDLFLFWHSEKEQNISCSLDLLPHEKVVKLMIPGLLVGAIKYEAGSEKIIGILKKHYKRPKEVTPCELNQTEKSQGKIQSNYTTAFLWYAVFG